MLRAFHHDRHTEAVACRPADGYGAAELALTIRRCLYREVAVVGSERYPAGCAAIAGPRPRRSDEPHRERPIRVRLVRDPEGRRDLDAIGVVTATGVMIGQVPRVSARRMAPALNRALEMIGSSRECAGCTIDVWCTAFVIAEWGPVDRAAAGAGDPPAFVGVTLLVDDGDLGIKLSAPELPVLV